MATELQVALIAAVVAFVTAWPTWFFTWYQIKRERSRWLIDLKQEYSTELYKARLAAYPKALEIIGKLSARAAVPATPDIARTVANELNGWFYSAGGLYADTRTRGALLGLRESCLAWKQGSRPPELLQWRDAAVFLLRRDLDLQGLESFDQQDSAPLLEKIKKDLEALGK